jgi:hypothetical protein
MTPVSGAADTEAVRPRAWADTRQRNSWTALINVPTALINVPTALINVPTALINSPPKNGSGASWGARRCALSPSRAERAGGVTTASRIIGSMWRLAHRVRATARKASAHRRAASLSRRSVTSLMPCRSYAAITIRGSRAGLSREPVTTLTPRPRRSSWTPLLDTAAVSPMRSQQASLADASSNAAHVPAPVS